MSQLLDMAWVQSELIPFLDLVYNVATGHDAKKHEDWESDIARAEKRINTIRNYDNSIISIDRIRLALTQSPHMTAEDRIQAEQVIKDQELVITMLVRYAISNGPYKLVSLGVGKNEAAIHEREALRQNQQKLPDMVTAKVGRIGRGTGYPGIGNRYSSNRNQILSGWNLSPRATSGPWSPTYNPVPSASDFSSAQYSVGVIGRADPYKSMYPQQNSAAGGSTPYAFAAGILGSANTKSPFAMTGNKEGLLTKAFANAAKAQVPPSAVGGELKVDVPVFVPGNTVHKMLHAPVFVPGVKEHITFSMMTRD